MFLVKIVKIIEIIEINVIITFDCLQLTIALDSSTAGITAYLRNNDKIKKINKIKL